MQHNKNKRRAQEKGNETAGRRTDQRAREGGAIWPAGNFDFAGTHGTFFPPSISVGPAVRPGHRNIEFKAAHSRTISSLS